ncbi:MAG: hypothetical protein MUP45_04530 [Candidatus Marinimicrobia bacterium]|nr:hypothetical protein [Candidatus Neomarinimicrobiota bacterium]
MAKAEETERKALLVVFVKGNLIDDFERVAALVKHGGVDVIIQTDENICSTIRLYFKEKEVCEAVFLILKSFKYSLMFQSREGWQTLVGGFGDFRIKLLFTSILDYLKMAGFRVLTSDNWLQEH